MPRYRLSDPAKADIGSVLRASEAIHGPAARTRYRSLLTAALRQIAADPAGPSTVDRSDLLPGTRRFHIRHSRAGSREMPVGDPVHIIFYRAEESGLVEVVRVLHQRIDATRRVRGTAPKGK